MGTTDFRPSTKSIANKFVTGDYVGDRYSETKFGANLPMEDF